MAEGPVKRALGRVDVKKAAILGESEIVDTGELAGPDECDPLALLSGFDVDRNEIEAARAQAERMATIAMTAGGGHPVQVAATLWFEGVVIGLLLSEELQKQKARKAQR